MKFLSGKFSLICALSAFLFVTAPLEAELAGHWTFDNSSNPGADSSGNANNGTLAGASWTTSFEGRDGVIHFDGDNDFVEVSDSVSLSIVGDITIAAWVYVDDFSNFRSIVSKTGIQSYPHEWQRPAPYDLYLWSTADPYTPGTPSFLSGDGTQAGSGGLVGNSGINAGEWHHVAVSQSGTTVSFYLDGILSGSGTVVSVKGDDNMSLYIGNRRDSIYGTSTTDFAGYLDDVRIYNEALIADQIAELVPEPSSLALLSFALGLVYIRRMFYS